MVRTKKMIHEKKIKEIGLKYTKDLIIKKYGIDNIHIEMPNINIEFIQNNPLFKYIDEYTTLSNHSIIIKMRLYTNAVNLYYANTLSNGSNLPDLSDTVFWKSVFGYVNQRSISTHNQDQQLIKAFREDYVKLKHNYDLLNKFDKNIRFFKEILIQTSKLHNCVKETTVTKFRIKDICFYSNMFAQIREYVMRGHFHREAKKDYVESIKPNVIILRNLIYKLQYIAIERGNYKTSLLLSKVLGSNYMNIKIFHSRKLNTQNIINFSGNKVQNNITTPNFQPEIIVSWCSYLLYEYENKTKTDRKQIFN